MFAEAVLNKAKIFNEKMNEKKDNWIKDKINNETFKKALKSDLGLIFFLKIFILFHLK